MDINELIQAISTLGFPIVMCCALFWKMNKQDTQHKEEMDKLSSVINELKLAITELKNTITNNGGK